MNAFARSWALFKSTLAVLNADKALLWFPVLATTATLAVSAVIFGGAAAILVANPGAQAYLSQAAAAAEAGNATLLQMIFFFASLFFYYLVINFHRQLLYDRAGGRSAAALCRPGPWLRRRHPHRQQPAGRDLRLLGHCGDGGRAAECAARAQWRQRQRTRRTAGGFHRRICLGRRHLPGRAGDRGEGSQPLRGHQGECVAAAPHLGRAVDRRIGDRPDLLCDYAAAGVSGRVDHHRLWRIRAQS
jgi:hypothetical protein